jgi:hypothetical protein
MQPQQRAVLVDWVSIECKNWFNRSTPINCRICSKTLCIVSTGKDGNLGMNLAARRIYVFQPATETAVRFNPNIANFGLLMSKARRPNKHTAPDEVAL